MSFINRLTLKFFYLILNFRNVSNVTTRYEIFYDGFTKLFITILLES